MKSLWSPSNRREVIDRLNRLTPGAAAAWGRMSAPEMVAHLVESMRMTYGDLPTKPKDTPLRRPLLKQLIVYVLPWPKGAPTAPELLTRPPAEWASDVSTLAALIERFGTRTPHDAWPEHPAFGRLTPRAWGRLAYRHVDHHLRQFGV